MSRKQIFPSHSCSMVKEMVVSIELRVSWKAVTPFFLMMQKLSFFLHTFIINLHSPFFFILTHLYSYFVIHFYPLKTLDQTVESLYFLNIFSQRSSLKFLICLTLATVLQYFEVKIVVLS